MQHAILLFLVTSAFYLNWISCQQDDIYNSEIHRLWPSLRMPNVIISKPAAKEEAEKPGKNDDGNTTSVATAKKTVVFPSPICISLPIAPCIILQVFWRNSSSNVLGARVPTNRIPSWPKPREQQLSNSQYYKMHLG